MNLSHSAGGVVIGPDKIILLVKQLGRFISWSLPKGHINPNEDPLTAARREVFEESGIENLEYLADLGEYRRSALDNPGEAKSIRMFLFKTEELKLNSQFSQETEAYWETLERALDLLTHPKDKEFLLSVRGKIEGLG